MKSPLDGRVGTQVNEVLDLRVERMAHGGRAVARHDGQVVFVSGAYPGEVVAAEVVGRGKRHLVARTQSVIEPSPSRVDAPCAHFGTCGGCQWQTAGHSAQLEWKREVVRDQLVHLGRLPGVDVRPTLSPGPAFGYRNRMDFKLIDGRPALVRGESHDLVAISRCHLMSIPVQQLFENLETRPRSERVTLRASEATGESLVLFDEATGVMHEEVAGVRFRITGRAFFQVNTAGAEALVRLVGEALEPQPQDRLLDGYAGGGLFSATIGRRCREVFAVESNQSTLRDLAHNTEAIVINTWFEKAGHALPPSWSLAVVDPPRTGLGPDGVEVVTSGHPDRIAYVSCDPASFARDAALLAASGYQLTWVQPVDLFPQTFHVEMVGAFEK